MTDQLSEKELRGDIKLVLKQIPAHVAKLEVHPYDYYINQILALIKEKYKGYVKLTDAEKHILETCSGHHL